MKRRLNEDRVIVTRAYAAATAAATASATSNNSISEPSNSPPCFKLIFDCWEYIFDCLSIGDVYSMAQTCKRMHRLAGNYHHECFDELNYEMKGTYIQCSYPHWYYLKPIFFQFVSKLQIGQHSKLNHPLDARAFTALKTLIYDNVTLNGAVIKGRQSLLRNVEHLHLISDMITGDIFKPIRTCCPKLTHLKVHRCHIATANKLFLQHFPCLEHLEYVPGSSDCDNRMDQLETFLKKHPNLKYITANFRFLWTHRDVFIEYSNTSNTQLEILNVFFNVPLEHVPLDEFFEFIKQLFARGIYKSLHLSFDNWNVQLSYESLSNALATLPALQELSVLDHSILDVSRLTNLRVFHMMGVKCSAKDAEILAKSLINLETLMLQYAPIDTIFPFIWHSKKLKKMITDYITSYDRALDLIAFNQQRKLANACKLSIHVQDRVYLPTRWKYENLNLSHVKVARSYLY